MTMTMVNPRYAMLAAAALVAVILVVYYMSNKAKAKTNADGFKANPWDILHNQIDERRRGGKTTASDLQRKALSLQAISPERLAAAEQEAWQTMSREAGSGSFNAESVHDQGADMMQHHAPAPPLDYNSFVTDLVADSRTRENHRRWAEEMKPFSGRIRSVDNMDEAMEASIHFQGLRRPQPVAQHNPLQITEVDANTLSGNKKFNFQG